MAHYDPVRSNAQAKLAAAEADVTRWKQFLVMYDEAADSPFQKSETSSTRPGEPLSFQAVRNYIAHRASSGALAETERAVLEIIKTTGRALHTRELLALLKQQGVEVGGKDPASTLSARLSRAPNLENVRPYGWRAKESSQEDEAAREVLPEHLAASVLIPNSADEDGREVAHGNMT